MSQRERNRSQETATVPAPGDAGGNSGDLARAERLFASSDEAIDRALSADSERFVANHVQ
jgi:hypothetical protein